MAHWSFLEVLQLVTSSGILAGGLGVLKWGISMERRVMRCEVTLGIDQPHN